MDGRKVSQPSTCPSIADFPVCKCIPSVIKVQSSSISICGCTLSWWVYHCSSLLSLIDQASGHLTGTNLPRRGNPNPTLPAISIAPTPNTTTASTLWRNSVRTIGDILVLSDIINPQAYLAVPFTNQAFFVAACCYVWGESTGPLGWMKLTIRN